MAQMPGMDEGVSGKRFVPALFLGVVLFSLIMGYGTWWVAQQTTPWFKARFERQKAEKAKQASQTPAPEAAKAP